MSPRQLAEIRHFAVAGVSFSGSTVFSCTLGAINGCANVGESHWLYDKFEKRLEPPLDRFDCAHCGASCEYLSPRFQRKLYRAVNSGRSKRTWYEHLRRRLPGKYLISSDKNHRNLERLQGTVGSHLIVLYKSPEHAWWSNTRKQNNDYTLEQYIRIWTRAYSYFLDRIKVEGGDKIFINFEAFSRDPSAIMEKFGRKYSLPWTQDCLQYWEKTQHYVGGHFNIYKMDDEARRIKPLPNYQLTPAELTVLQSNARLRAIFDRMEKAFQESFSPAENS